VLHCRRALLFGDGDGRFAARLLAAAPDLQAEAVDGSGRMLALLRRRAEKASATAAVRLSTHVADALEYTPALQADLVVTHFFLDCLSAAEVRRFVEGVRGHLDPGALWLVSDFRIPPAGALRVPAWVLVRALYLGFRVLTGLRTRRLADYAEVLQGAGFVRVEQRLGLWRLSAEMRPGSISETEENAMIAPERMNLPNDPVPDPEPASPSLEEPDPGVFHHTPEPPSGGEKGFD
jgi:SAM-dependent methyltransferase